MHWFANGTPPSTMKGPSFATVIFNPGSFKAHSSASCAWPIALRSFLSSLLQSKVTFSDCTEATASIGTVKSPAFSTKTVSSFPLGEMARTAPKVSGPSETKV
jgi:hypothetical protein